MDTTVNKFIKDEKGSALPMIAVVLILVIFIGTVNFALVVMYRDRTSVRSALDAGVTSSMSAATEEKKERRLYYGYRTPCIDGYWDHYTDSEGKSKKRWICTRRAYVNSESGSIKNYIYLNKVEGSNIAKQYFKENLELNNIKNYRIISWDYSVIYDDKRYYEVIKNRGLDWSKSDYVNRLTNPDDWWRYEFGDSEPDSWSRQPETRRVRFPRWVEVTAKVTIELPVPLGNLIGKESYRVSFDTVAFKELIQVDE